MNLYNLKIKKLEELNVVVQNLDSILQKPACVFIEGEMGVGKTTLISKFVKQKFNIVCNSPTYSIVSEYNRFVHADFYRIRTTDELLYLEMSESASNKEYLFFEWGYQFKDFLISELDQTFNYYLLNIVKEKNKRQFILKSI